MPRGTALRPGPKSSGTPPALCSVQEDDDDRRSDHHQARAASFGIHRPRLRTADLVQLLQGASGGSPDDVPRAGMGPMNRTLAVAPWMRDQDHEAHRKLLESEARRVVAEAANRAKDEFLAHVSHEIRTPMNAVLGLTELVLDGPLSASQRQSLETARAAAGHLLRMVDDLLDLSKIEAGKLELGPPEVRVRDLLDETIRTLAVGARAKGLELVSDVHAEVPDRLVGDSARLREVLFNIVGNAIKFTEAGEVALDVTVARDRADDSGILLRFAVRDTGIGIAKERQEAIFRPFEQEDAASARRYGGTGLGLAIAARLVALFGGEISVDSAPGRGSTFTFTVPFKVAPQVSQDEPVESLDPVARTLFEAGANEDPEPRPEPAPPLRILVAEDDEFSWKLMEQLLSKRGHEVRRATTGTDTIALADELEPDLLLLDLHMPEMDGIEVVDRIRNKERFSGGHLPVIAVTARKRDQDRQRCLLAGVDEFLSKPIRANDLWKAVERLHTTGEEA